MLSPKAPKLWLAVVLSLAFGGALWARKEVQMPEDFGKDSWVVAHYTEAVGYLKYLVNNEERQKLLSVPESLRLEAWNQFWKTRDPVASTSANEFRDEYYARIRYANENFAEMLLPGWLTDRGEAYIRLGPPIDIERYTMRAGGKDVLIWQYWAPREINLVFIDRTGVGDLYLLNPGDMLDRAFIYGR